MNRLGKIVVCLASGLVLNAGARADDGVLPNNPYAPIMVRNVFGLNPPQAVDPASQGEPPPKITLNGIMSIFGQLQALYKVAGTAKPGQPAKDESYILSEGQRQDEIEVTHIDEKASLVTFNNHGTVQELPLVNAPEVSTPTPGQGRLVPTVPTQNITAPNVDNSGRGRFGSRSASGPGAALNRGSAAGSTGSTLTTVPTRAGNYGQQEKITPEAQILMMEIYREQHKNDTTYPTLPPTAMTPPGTKNPNGTPVVMPDLEQ